MVTIIKLQPTAIMMTVKIFIQTIMIISDYFDFNCSNTRCGHHHSTAAYRLSRETCTHPPSTSSMYNDWNDGVNDDDCNQCDHFEPQRRGANVDMTQRNPTNDQN